MSRKRRVAVRILAAIAFIVLFLLPVLGFMTTDTVADVTAQSASVYSGDYVFFVVSNEEVPLAASPVSDTSSYIMYMGLAMLAVTIMSLYSAWYASIRRNITEFSEKLSPADRRFFNDSRSFFHPIRSYRLAKDAEDSVASLYFGNI